MSFVCFALPHPCAGVGHACSSAERQRERERERERAIKTRAPLTKPCSSMCVHVSNSTRELLMGMECTSTRELLIRLGLGLHACFVSL